MSIRIILIGPPGVGKGTQSAFLTEQFGVVQISTGDLFRNHMKAGTSLGNLAKRYIEQGRLVPNGVTLEMLAERMRMPDVQKKGFILDGYPRNVDQAHALAGLLEELEENLDAVIAIEVGDDTLVKRLSGRMGCTKCGAIYNMANKPPKRDWICDVCNSPLFVRDDDKPETIRERLKIFHEQTKPVVDHYAETGIVTRIDGTLEPAVVYQEILSALKLN